jgi:hypothetical protein
MTKSLLAISSGRGVEVLSTPFTISQLDRERTLRLYVRPSYSQDEKAWRPLLARVISFLFAP